MNFSKSILDDTDLRVTRKFNSKFRQNSLPASSSSPPQSQRYITSGPVVIMRGSALRNGARPANSMEQDSFDSYDDSEDMIIGAANNLSLSPAGSASSGGDRDALNVSESETELPKSIIVTNVDLLVFDDEETKANFEVMFREFEAGCTFHYLRSFRRIRIDFDTHLSASNAKINLDGTPVGDNIIHCYFIQVLTPSGDDGGYLHVPPIERQWLISPPASPPVGWVQPNEGKPIVDLDLLAAMAQLTPGENHELHPAKQVTMLGKSISTPSIVVQVCENPEDLPTVSATKKIKGTKCPDRHRGPDRQSSLD